MANRLQRFALGAIAFPLLFLISAGTARAATIVVNTTGAGSIAGACTLEDAVRSANNQATPGLSDCIAGSGHDDVIAFSVTGKIVIEDPLNVVGTSNENLTILGPPLGCTGSGPCGIQVDGGGLVQLVTVDSGATVTLQYLTLEDGFSATNGGGIVDQGSLTIENCLLQDNVADDTAPGGVGMGGAIYVPSTTPTPTLYVINSTFANNTAEGNSSGVGGAIANGNGSGTASADMKITNTTFFNNIANAGTAYAAMFKPSVKATIFSSTSASTNCATAKILDEGFNISSDASCGTSHDSHSAGLGTLGNNGGPTDTVPLEGSSLAIGLDTTCTDQQTTPEPVLIDQRGFTRPNSPTMCDTGAYEHDGLQSITLVPGSERLQVASSSNPDSSVVNTAFTVIDNGPPSPPNCNAGNNLLNGFEIFIDPGTCADMSITGIFEVLSPFVVHTVGHVSYGTFFSSVPGLTTSARILQLTPTPVGACGEFNLNIEFSNLNTGSLSGGNPYALTIEDGDGNFGCFDITNAIVGSVIDPPKKTVRRDVRR